MARTSRLRLVRTFIVAALTATAAACDGSGGSEGTSPSATTETLGQAPTTTSPEDAVLESALVCDPLDEHRCLLPWPNDAFTRPDPTSPTGRRLHLDPTSTPRNADGVHIDVTDINRGDGFSPGAAILAFVPNLDLAASGFAPSTDIARSLDEDAPAVLLDSVTGERLAYWAELDAQAPDGEQLLMIHPATSLLEGHRVVVALRNLVDTSGTPIPRSTAMQAVIDNVPEPLERAAAMRAVIADLAAADIGADEVYLAWDFTVASGASLSGRLLSMREDAYESLGTQAPAFEVVSATDDQSVRTIEATIEVPNFLTGDGGPGTAFDLDADGLPRRNNTTPNIAARVTCVVPLAPANPVPAIVYGHGLLGDRSEATALRFAAEQNLAAVCGTDWIGMSSEDIPTVLEILADLSRFNEQADRLQQGHLNMQFLGRALNHPAGFVSHPSFQAADGTPLIAANSAAFVGNSQGGILGGAASAISSEWSRVVLGVPGINYSLLLHRSSDWPQFQTVFDAAYPDAADRVLALQLIQLLWDRGENNGYAQHLTSDPYPGTAAKSVLMIGAYGDHQVANVATYVLARTVDAAIHLPVLAPDDPRQPVDTFGFEAVPADGSPVAVLVMWDYGTPSPPAVNLAPFSPDYGSDPHGAGSSEPAVLTQAFTFLLTGTFTNPCGDAPCRGRQIDS